jgi:phage gpG-like protein
VAQRYKILVHISKFIFKMARNYTQLAQDGREMQQNIKKELKKAIRKITNTTVNHYKSSFRNQGFAGDNAKWKPRKNIDQGRAILVQSGDLRRSIKGTNQGNNIIISSDKPYAEIHNQGGTINTTVSVKAFSRKTKSGKTANVKAHTRNVNTQIPKRQFMGIPGEKPDDSIIKKIEQIMTDAIKATIPR